MGVSGCSVSRFVTSLLKSCSSFHVASAIRIQANHGSTEHNYSPVCRIRCALEHSHRDLTAYAANTLSPDPAFLLAVQGRWARSLSTQYDSTGPNPVLAQAA